MSLLHPNAINVAKKYIGPSTDFEALGWGIDGEVFHVPSHHSVMKVLSHREKFDRELAVYQRLKRRKVTAVHGFKVPRLINFSEADLVVEMSFVRPPFLLDFVQTRLDHPLDFPEGMDEWWERLAQVFEDRLPTVRAVYDELRLHYGIYYYDLKVGNIAFAD